MLLPSRILVHSLICCLVWYYCLSNAATKLDLAAYSDLLPCQRVRKKCKINFNKPLALTINNLLKPLLSKPETILIQKSIKRYPPPNVQRNMQQPFLEVTTRTWPHTKQRVFRHPQKSNLQVRLFLFSKNDLRSKKDKLRLNFVQWELSLKSLFLYARSL